jgi:hypothetical protein
VTESTATSAGATPLAGASVVINHNHTPELAQKIVADIQAAGGAAIAATADVSVRCLRDALAVERAITKRRCWQGLPSSAGC